METKIYKADEVNEEILEEVSKALSNAAVIVIPTDTVYGLACEAANAEAREKICRLKERDSSIPMQILMKSAKRAKEISVWSDNAEKLANAFWPGEMTMVLGAGEFGMLVSGGFDTVGIRVPADKFTSELLNIHGSLAATSANLHGQPILKTEEEIMNAFNGRVDYIFLGGTIETQSSAVVQAEPFKVIREGSLKEKDFIEVLNKKEEKED
ncbi:L-threonylcarbamoyladenylate synthase [Parelusimicrobium proximum]|uniref:L-threonylcarbamoyladenylate synthase n=1 Tax=Parelusimicrobium proximum TaxID=3228953 RepID=UPI003D16FCE9